MATCIIVALVLWILTAILTGSPKTFPLLLLSLCLIIAAINPMQILMLPPEETLDEKFSSKNLNTKKSNINKQYENSMCKDKRFGQNHTKYLRLKAFAEF